MRNAPAFAIFASDRGPGDPERASLMSQTGTYFARRGGQIVVLAENGDLPVPLITAARTAGGMVRIVADESIVLPSALAGTSIEVLPDAAARQARVVELAQVLVALPGSLASSTALFGCWSSARAKGLSRPVLMLNRHRAYEVMRGLAADVISHGLAGYDKSLQFSDNVEDLWNRASRLAGEAR